MQYKVDRYGSGLTAEEYLLRQIPATPAGYLRQLFRGRKILRDNQPLDPGDTLNQGESLLLPGSARLQAIIVQAPPLKIVHETDQLIVLDKPAGLAVHRTGADEADLTSLLQALAKRRREPYRTSPVTRLDRGTSGLVVFAKGKKAAGELGTQVMERRWRKLYLGLVQGLPTRSGILDQPVTAKGKTRESRAQFRRLHAAADHALLEIDLHTGRTHQIRQQFAASGHPLVGDSRYGTPSAQLGERLFLHCARLELPVTDSDDRLSLTAPLPAELKRHLAWLWGAHR